MKQTDIDTRIAGLLVTKETARKLKSLATDDVAGFFEKMRAGLATEMIGAEIGDDTKRREAAMMLQLLNKFQGYLAGKITAGRDAEKQIVKLDERSKNE